MITEERLFELLPAAERGDWAALCEIPIELWPDPATTPAIVKTLQSLPPEEKQTLQAMLASLDCDGAEATG